MDDVKFYYCTVCGNIVEKVKDSGNDLECCSRTMEEMKAGTSDGKIEFHVPSYTVKDNIVEVSVGEKPHPMEKDHYIQWVELVTNKGMARKCLKPGDEPKVRFHLCDGEKVCGVFAYCNLHKLWRA